MPFQVIPVIDLLNGQAVHAIGGRRAYYQPIQSVLHPSCEPIALARAIRDGLGLETLYVADLDAIEGGTPSLGVFRKIIASGLHLWIDAGVRDVDSMAPLLALDQSSCTVVAGLETLRGPCELAAIVEQTGADRVILSLDLFEGSARIANSAAWGTEDPLELAETAIKCGARRLLILDLARVGTSRGTGTGRLMKQICQSHSSVVVIIGGGISRIDEIAALRDAGARAVLVGSALHDGRIGARELALLVSGTPPYRQPS